jgi:hypothetical protein
MDDEPEPTDEKIDWGMRPPILWVQLTHLLDGY